MFGNGTFLAGTVGGGPLSSKVIPVSNASPFGGARKTAPIHCVFIHAPSWDGLPPFDYYIEERDVTGADTRRNEITISTPLDRIYGIDSTGQQVTGRLFPDAIGILTGTVTVFEATPTLIGPVFTDAFVDYVELNRTSQNIVPYFPYVENGCGAANDIYLARKWCDTCVGGTLAANTHHLVGGAECSATGIVGETILDDNGAPTPVSYVWVKAIQRLATDPSFSFCSPYSPANWVTETSVHELAHEWKVNPPVKTVGQTVGTGGHCSNPVWNGTVDCGMRRDANENVCRRMDGAFTFHSWNLNSEFLTIRTAPEPVPQRY